MEEKKQSELPTGASPLQVAAINKALAMLRGAGAQFAVIDLDGNKHGELEVVPPQVKKKRNMFYKFGELHNHYWPLMENMKPGELVRVPVNGFEPERLRGAMAAAACNHWGPGTAMTSVVGETVDVMRIA